MSYFPAFIKVDKAKVLIVGGGKIAGDKLKHMLDFTKNISIIAPIFSESVKSMCSDNLLDCKKRSYENGDIDGFDIVIVAVDDLSLQKSIYEEAKNKGVLCNAVDSAEYCDFIFPSYIKKGDLTVAISTSGASPSIAKYLRQFLTQIIPDNIATFLKEARELRSTLPKGKERMKLLDKKAKKWIETNMLKN